MNKHRILFIDDNENDYLIFSRYIKSDYATDYYDGKGDVAASITECKPSVIFLDYHLGPILGINILKIIKSTSNVPVVLLTNEESPDVIVSCMKNGADDYLIKDRLDRNRLLVTIKNKLEKAAALQHVKQLESFLPICSVCKKIRTKDSDPRVQSSWIRIEQYIEEHTESVFSHGLCPDCMYELYGDKFN